MYLEFEKYLQSTGISAKSIKNYKSDISHFASWAISKLKAIGTHVDSVRELTPFLSSSFASEYLSHMESSGFPEKTINRRLSTLRHLSKFLIASQVIDFDFMNQIQNLSSVKVQKVTNVSSHPSIAEFKSFLEAEKVSANTIKNYLSDIRQFMSWLESNHAHFT